MTVLTGSPVVRRPMPAIGHRLVLLALVLGAAALTSFMNASSIAETLRGHLGDPDDAMRLVEVRAWRAGQSWFDMTATRLNPPQGSFMHWSRLVDLPAAAMIKLFGLFTDPGRAERLALVAVPTLWLVALYAGVSRMANILLGQAGRIPVVLGTLFSGAALVQFGPGRIGHHAPETVALVFEVGCTLAALDCRRVREGFIAGLLFALSLAMSLETLPFQVALVGLVVLLWVWRGRELVALIGWFGAGLLTGLPLFFALTVGPDRWIQPVCDAYSAAHLGAGMIGAAGLLALALTGARLTTPVTRMIAAFCPAVLAGAFVASAFPTCLHSPFAEVDPLVRALWLDHVSESLPLPAFFQKHPMLAVAFVLPATLGVAGSAVAAITAQGVHRLRFLLIAGLSAFGVGLSLWQVRVIASVTPLALCGGVYLVVRTANYLGSRGLAVAAKFAPLAILLFTSTFWALALPKNAPTSNDSTAACLAPDALAALAGLPAGAAVAPINSGSHLLKDTKLSVFAAPYHRNNDGNRFAYEVFMAPPEEARQLLSDRHVNYVIVCPGMVSHDRVAARAPDGLAAQLAAGQVPGFLQAHPLSDTLYRVYDVKGR